MLSVSSLDCCGLVWHNSAVVIQTELYSYSGNPQGNWIMVLDIQFLIKCIFGSLSANIVLFVISPFSVNLLVIGYVQVYMLLIYHCVVMSLMITAELLWKSGVDNAYFTLAS